jgi:phosphoglycolate phosphatase
MIKYTLFDFDGTLVDSRAVFITAFNQLAAKHHFDPITEGNIEDLRKLSLIPRLQYLKVPFYKIPMLTGQFSRIYKKELSTVEFVDGMVEVLNKIIDMNMPIAIISSNAKTTIAKFLEEKQVSIVSEIMCSSRLFAKEKVIKKFLKQQGLKASEVMYVCDEVRDIEACKRIDVKSVWVSWGYETMEAVEAGKEQLVASRPGELIEIISKDLN